MPEWNDRRDPRHPAGPSQADPPSETTRPRSESPAELVPRYRSLNNEHNARLFAQGVLETKQRFRRVTERIHCIDEVRLRREIDVSLSVLDANADDYSGDGSEASPPTHLIVPLLSFRKDRLLDDQPVCNWDGGSVVLLNRAETRDMHSYAISVAVMDALDGWINQGSDARSADLRRSAAATFAYILGDIPKTPPLEARRIYDDVFKSDASNPAKWTKEAIEARALIAQNARLTHLCRRLTTHEYMLVLSDQGPSSGPTIDFKVSYEAPYVVEERRRTPGAWLRVRLGFWPHEFMIHAPLVQISQSYHIRMLGPPNHFVWEQAFMKPGSGGTRKDNASAAKVGFVYVRPPRSGVETILGLPRRPSREGHLFAGELDSEDAPELIASFKFEERPPGMQGKAAALGAALTAILVAFLLSRDALVPTNSSIDAAALLVLAPGIAAAIFIPSFTDPLVVQGPMGARLVLMATVFVSLAGAVALAVGSRAGGGTGSDQGFLDSGAGTLTSFWVVLIALEMSLTLLLLVRIVRAYGRYSLVRKLYVKVEELTRAGELAQDRFDLDRFAWLEGRYDGLEEFR